jgi:hypothetical protein
MPSYLLWGSNGRGNGLSACCDNTVDRNSAMFFSNLATKLLDMSKAIEKRMEELANKVCATESGGFLLASIDTPAMSIGIKYEFIEYIKRYGPPHRGKFDEKKLRIIRKELNIHTMDDDSDCD